MAEDLQLGEFLSRPVIVYTGSWTENAFHSASIDPFKLLLSNTAIKNKLTGYRYFRAGMRVTVTLSSSPFLYSCLQVSYAPLESSTESFGFKTATGSSQSDVLLKSNLPFSGWVYPQDCKPLVFEIPFIYPVDWVNITSSNPSAFGFLRLASAIPLRSAGVVGTATCTISVVAQFIDPEVCGLTASQPQSNTMAGASKDLSRAGFGSASAWANVASKALKLVGLSNPSDVEVTKPTVSKLFTGLSNVDTPVLSEPLSMGYKTGLLSDPHLGHGDELDIASICAKPSTIMMAPWATTNAAGDAIFRAYVTPCQLVDEVLTGAGGNMYDKFAMTSACYLSTFFTKWRGTVCYRFKPICSQFHRGKLRVYYDSGFLSNAPAEGVLTSQIIDLAEVGECVIKVPMNTACPWLSVLPWLTGGYPGFDAPTTFGTSLNSSYAASLFNGTIRVQVMQALTSPNAIGNIVIQVDSWVEDAQFADPCHWTTTGGGALTIIDPSPWQSGDDEVDVLAKPLVRLPKLPPPSLEPATVVPRDKEQAFDGNLGLGVKDVVLSGPGVVSKGRAVSKVIGEDIISMRALAHRATFYKPIGPRKDQTVAIQPELYGQPGIVSTTIPRMPRFFGSELKTNMISVCHKALTAPAGSVMNFNFVNESAFIRLAALFIGYKGSIRWRFATSSTNLTGDYQIGGPVANAVPPAYPHFLWATRTNFPPGREVVPAVANSSSYFAYDRLNFVADSGSGVAVANLDHSGLTVDMPDYNVVNFMPVNPFLDLDGTWYQSLVANRGGEIDNITLTVQTPFVGQLAQSAPAGSVDSYVSACPDMRFFYYRGPPVVYRTFQKPSPSPWNETA